MRQILAEVDLVAMCWTPGEKALTIAVNRLPHLGRLVIDNQLRTLKPLEVQAS